MLGTGGATGAAVSGTRGRLEQVRAVDSRADIVEAGADFAALLADDVAAHQEVNRAFAAAGAVMVGATVAIIENHGGGVDAAVAQFRELPA